MADAFKDKISTLSKDMQENFAGDSNDQKAWKRKSEWTMEEKKEMLQLLEKAEEYSNTKYELLKLQTVDKGSDILAALVLRIAKMALFAVFLLLINVGIALWLGALLKELYLGFFALAAIYGIIILFLHFALSKSIKQNLRDSFIKQMLQ